MTPGRHRRHHHPARILCYITLPAITAGLLLATRPAPVHATATTTITTAKTATAPVTTTICTTPGQAVDSWTRTTSGEIIRDDAWARPLCLTTTTGIPGYTAGPVTAGHGVAAFPDILYGWSWGLHSDSTILPAPVSTLPGIYADWVTANRPAGIWNKSLDMWLSATPAETGQDLGCEVMIWTATRGYASWARFPVTEIDGTAWHVDEWMTPRTENGKRISWPLVIFNRAQGDHSERHLLLAPFFAYAEARGWMRPGFYLTGIEAGDEIQAAGGGLTITHFTVGGLPA